MPKHTIGLYLFLTLVKGLGISFISATYVMFLISRGLNLFEISLVNFVFFTTLFFCEIPTGAIADNIGRKASFVISCFLLSVSMFIYAVMHSFWGFAFAEVVAAVGITFSSGAFQAWLVDKLKSENYKGSLGAVFAKEQQITNLAGIIGAFCGAYLADKNILFPWIAGGLSLLLAGFLAMVFMREEYFVPQKLSFKEGISTMKKTALLSFQYSRKNKAFKFIALMGFFHYFAIQAPNMQWQPFFSQFLSSKTSLGAIFGAISVSLILGSAFSSSFLRILGSERNALIVSQVIVGAGVFATVLFACFPFALGIFLVHEFARGLFRPIKDLYLNENIPSKERATLISFESMFRHIGGMKGLLFCGFVAEYVSISAAWMFSGGVLLVSALYLMKNGRH